MDIFRNLFAFFFSRAATSGDIPGMARDPADVLDTSSDLQVSLVSPPSTPAVPNFPVVAGVPCEGDSVVGPTLAVSVGPNSLPVSPKIDVPEVHGYS